MQRIRQIRLPKIRLTLRSRLVTGYVGVLLLLALFAELSYLQFSRMVQANQALAQASNHLQSAEEMSNAVQRLVISMDEGILLRDGGHFKDTIQPALNSFRNQQQVVDSSLEHTAALDSAIARLVSFVDPMTIQAQNNEWNLIQSNRLTRLNDSIQSVDDEIQAVIQDTRGQQTQALLQAEEAQGAMQRNVAIALALAFFLGGFMVISTISSITRPMQLIISSAKEMAAGNLDQIVPVESQDEIGQLATAFNQMAADLKSLYNDMESRIQERTESLEKLTGDLRASADVAGAATKILDPNALLAHIVELISQRFGFYHTGIFLLDDTRTEAVLQAASSMAGKRMLARNHKLRLGQGIVGHAVQEGEARASQIVQEDSTYYNNPDLPETRAELALPLRARGQIIGALDVQSELENAFTTDKVAILQTLADQVALALENAKLYQETQTRFEEIRHLYSDYSLKAWDEVTRNRGGIAYRYTPETGVQFDPSQPELLLENSQAMHGEDNTLSVPIKVREQVIGVMKVRKPAGSNEWTPENLGLLDSITEQLGVALDSARLFTETQQQAQRERLVGEINARMRQTLDVEAVVRTATNEIYQALSLESLDIWLSADEVGEVEENTILHKNGNGRGARGLELDNREDDV
jgi:GAF domain-containing protein/HAMP domain-containing protein